MEKYKKIIIYSLIVFLFVSSFILRVGLIKSSGLYIDIQYFKDWSFIAQQKGIDNVYDEVDGKLSVDYPPIYPYFLGLVSNISVNLLNIQIYSKDYETLLKTINLLVDVINTLIIFTIVFKLSKNKLISITSGLVYFINPYVFFDSVKWGQVDNLIAFFSLISILLIVFKKYIWVLSILVLGLLTKFQIIIFVPLITLYTYFQSNLKTLIKGSLLALITLLLVILPLITTNSVDKMVYTYTTSTNRYPFITMNAFNLWWLFTNPNDIYQVKSDTPINKLEIAPYRKIDYDETIFNVKNLAYLLFGLTFLIVLVNLFVDRSFNNLIISLSVVSLGFFVLNVQMHERYLFPFFALWALIALSKLKYFIIYIILSLSAFFNLFVVFYPEFFTSVFPSISYLISITNIAILVYLIIEIIINIYTNRKRLKWWSQQDSNL